jgi:hypothetical protein
MLQEVYSWMYYQLIESSENEQRVRTWPQEQWGIVTSFRVTSAEFSFKASAGYYTEFRVLLSS